jgi:hypothetical protein
MFFSRVRQGSGIIDEDFFRIDLFWFFVKGEFGEYSNPIYSSRFCGVPVNRWQVVS